MEKFDFFGLSISSFSLLKATNPLIGLMLLPSILISRPKISIPILALTMILLLGISNWKKNDLISKFTNNGIFFTYIPPELFLKSTAIISEEKFGIYNFFREEEQEDPIYKFTLKPIRNIPYEKRKPIQTIISKIDFPIVIYENGIVQIFDLSRNFNGVNFQIKYEPDSKKATIQGPIF